MYRTIYIVIFSSTYEGTYQEQNVAAFDSEDKANAFCKKYEKIISETNEFKLLKEDLPCLNEDYSEKLIGRTNCHYLCQAMYLL